MSTQKKLGYKGENLAKNFLIDNGYLILHTNWVFAHKEVDIITENDEFIIFTEVKTRKIFNSDIDLLSIITTQKMNYLITAAQAYIDKFHIEKEVRFDVILVFLSGNRNIKIKHIENAFNNII